MPIQTKRYRIRHLTKQEVPNLLQICKKEGRHMGSAEEVGTWMSVDPFGIFVAVDEDGTILGSCAGIRLSRTHGYIGMYIMDSKHRNLGIGKQIWNQAIQHLGTRNIGLSAVADLFELYRDRAGFKYVESWTVDLYKLERMPKLYKHLEHFGSSHSHSHSHSAVESGDESSIYELSYEMSERCSLNGLNGLNGLNALSVCNKLRTEPIDESLIRELIKYDRKLHSYDRSKIVSLTVRESLCRTRVALLGDTIVGYGCIKPNLQSLWMITPLYADNEFIARMLMSDLLMSLSSIELDRGVVLKTPSNNSSAVNLLKKLGFEKQDYFLKRQYSKAIFSVPTHCIYALHTSVFCTE